MLATVIDYNQIQLQREVVTIPNSTNILFNNVVIQQAESDSGALRLKVIYAGREYQDIQYDDVFYAQLDNSRIGMKISLAEELTPDELLLPKHSIGLTRLLSDLREERVDVMAKFAREQYRIFVHYSGKIDEYLVIAKRITVVNR